MIAKFENIEIRYLSSLGSMLRDILDLSEDGCANAWELFLKRLLSLPEILRAAPVIQNRRRRESPAKITTLPRYA
jgi:hypothetical protein